MTTIVFSRKSSAAQRKEDPRNVLSHLLPTWQQASSAVVSLEGICQRSDWHTKTMSQNTADMPMNNSQCNNSNYNAKYTTSSNSRQNFMKIGWIAACRQPTAQQDKECGLCQRPDLHTKTVLKNTAALSINSAKTLTVRHSTQLLLINTKNIMKIGWMVKRFMFC